MAGHTGAVHELVKRSATWMAKAFRDREVSAIELVDAHAARGAERNPQAGGWLDPDELAA